MTARPWVAPLLLLAACGPRAENEPQCVSAPLTGGAARGELLALAPSQEAALARLNLLGPSGSLGTCTGTLIGARAILTAAHCLIPEAVSLEVSFVGQAGQTEVVPTSDAVPHPELDLALINLAAVPGPASAPISIGRRPPSPDEVVQLGGFDDDALAFAATVVTELDAASFTVSADGRAAACFGDSGGPALARSPTGEVTVIGVLSSGKTSCSGSDRYVRLDAVGPWLESHGVDLDPGEALADCLLLPAAGRCFADTALWCDASGQLSVEQCEPGSACGFSTAASGFRCVPADRDPCQGVDDRGLCDGDTLSRCESGRVVRQACAECGATCQVSVVTGEAICNRE